MIASRCSVDAEAERAGPCDGLGGIDEDLSPVKGRCGGIAFDCISPLAVPSLFVNDDIAHPAQPGVSLSGVPIRGPLEPFVDAVLAGGRSVSGKVVPYLRTRWT